MAGLDPAIHDEAQLGNTYAFARARSVMDAGSSPAMTVERLVRQRGSSACESAPFFERLCPA